MSFSAAKHHILSIIIVLSLLLNQGLGVLNSASAMSSMQAFSDDDTLAICTGAQVKWISAAIFYASGNIVEVEAPDDTPQNLHEVSCVFAQLNDSPKDDIFHALQVVFSQLIKPIITFTKLLFVTGDYVNSFNARAPPLFL